MSDSEHTEKQSNGVKDGNISRFFDVREGHFITYEYQCSKCNSITEAEFIMGTADTTIPCGNPDCENGIASRIISTPNVLSGIPKFNKIERSKDE